MDSLGLCYDGGNKNMSDVCREKATALKTAFLLLKSLKKRLSSLFLK